MRHPADSVQWAWHALPKALVVLTTVAVALAFVAGSSAVSIAHHRGGMRARVPRLGTIIPRRLPPFIAYDAYGIYLVKPDGSDAHQIGPVLGPDATTDPAMEPSWSPRATRILYQVGCAIWVMKADGSDQRRVIPDRGDCGTRGGYGPRWSPGGKQIVYVGAGPLTAVDFIRIANADGSHDHLVPNSDGADSASFSPDGRYILFDAAFTDKRRIYVIRPNGTGLRPISPSGQEAIDPSWSPNGTRIIYLCSFYNGLPSTGHVTNGPWPHAICEISRTHPKPSVIYSVPSTGFIFSPVWSADGKKILFQVADTGGNSQLALLAPSGGTPTQITGDYNDPDW